MVAIEALDVTPKRAKCPVCKSSISITKHGQMRVHGPRRPDGRVCHGSNATVGFRYRVTDSTVEKVPTGTHLIYANFRGLEDEQTWLDNYEPVGGWAIKFMDVGIKYEGRWYGLDGTTEAENG